MRKVAVMAVVAMVVLGLCGNSFAKGVVPTEVSMANMDQRDAARFEREKTGSGGGGGGDVGGGGGGGGASFGFKNTGAIRHSGIKHNGWPCACQTGLVHTCKKK